MDKGLMQVKERLSKELADYAMRKDISNANLDTIYKSVKSIYYLTTMEAMDEYSQAGNSRGNSMNNSSMESYMSGYSRGYSEARRGRDGDSDGRYSEGYSREGSYGSYGYSGHDSKEAMIEEMRTMMYKLEPRDKQAVQQCIERMQG